MPVVSHALAIVSRKAGAPGAPRRGGTAVAASSGRNTRGRSDYARVLAGSPPDRYPTIGLQPAEESFLEEREGLSAPDARSM